MCVCMYVRVRVVCVFAVSVGMGVSILHVTATAYTWMLACMLAPEAHVVPSHQRGMLLPHVHLKMLEEVHILTAGQRV